MRRVRAGLVGAGFVGPLHLEAVRRLGYVDVAGLASRNGEVARRKADALGIERAYGSYEEMFADESIEVVHVCTPNDLHHSIVMAAIRAGKHVMCDKPLATSAAEGREMVEAARAARITGGITFNYRYNPLVQEARLMIADGELGDLRYVHGCYLQDWLMYDTDFSWRLEPERSGPSCAIGDIGSHLCDTAQYLTGRRITRLLASLQTTVPVRRKPGAAREAFSAAGDGESLEDYNVTTDDMGSVLVEFEGGLRGTLLVSQVLAGHKNDLRIEVNGSRSSLRWEQERPNVLWLGHRDEPNRLLDRDPALMDERVRRYARLPGGHQEGWADAFRNLMSNFYSFISEGRDPLSDIPQFPTFEDGYRAVCIVDAMLRSHADGSRWTDVRY